MRTPLLRWCGTLSLRAEEHSIGISHGCICSAHHQWSDNVPHHRSKGVLIGPNNGSYATDIRLRSFGDANHLCPACPRYLGPGARLECICSHLPAFFHSVVGWLLASGCLWRLDVSGRGHLLPRARAMARISSVGRAQEP